jgi:1-deoxy-D-xylulose-5-phosphate reductoisomerase
MGSKITIDSATLMNKGLEAIEARWLFDLKPEQIDIVIHPQSIIHSLVQFVDGSIKAQMGLPDMRLPIQYALGYPERLDNEFPRFDFTKYPNLTFEKPDLETFKALKLALEALRIGGNMTCVLNAANEIAVEAFLQDQIGFLDIAEIVEQTLAKVEFIEHPDIDDYVYCDVKSRRLAREFINKH